MAVAYSVFSSTSQAANRCEETEGDTERILPMDQSPALIKTEGLAATIKTKTDRV